jgi:hypothetical protein
MAILDPDSLFRGKGKLGQLVVRKVGNRFIASARPASFKKSNSIKAVSTRSHFSYANKFATYINPDPVLHEVWDLFSEENSIGYRSIISENRNLMTDQGPSISNIIVPPSEYNIINDISLIDNSINITFQKFPDISTAILDNLFRIFVLFAKVDDVYKLSCELFKTVVISKNGIDSQAINIELSDIVQDFIKRKKDLILYGAIVWNLKDNLEWRWSSSFGKKL